MTPWLRRGCVCRCPQQQRCLASSSSSPPTDDEEQLPRELDGIIVDQLTSQQLIQLERRQLLATALLAEATVEATQHGGGSWRLLLRNEGAQVDLAGMRVTVPEAGGSGGGGSAILHGASSFGATRALPLSEACGPLVMHALARWGRAATASASGAVSGKRSPRLPRHACDKCLLVGVSQSNLDGRCLPQQGGGEGGDGSGLAVVALAKVPKLCAWISQLPAEALEEEYGEEAAGAVTAVALSRPRPGHSVLGHGTFGARAAALLRCAPHHCIVPIDCTIPYEYMPSRS
eukprot:COSAG01_NODE_2857_length_6960_cov_44.361901_1_plen_289_part_00